MQILLTTLPRQPLVDKSASTILQSSPSRVTKPRCSSRQAAKSSLTKPRLVKPSAIILERVDSNSPTADSPMVSHVFAEGTYQCSHPGCEGVTLGQIPELQRHHDSVHDGFGGAKPQY